MRGDLPAGTVTFLFTDVEGSTRLLHEFGAEDYAKALAEHRRVLRAAFRAHGGVEVDTQGDAFFYAFPTAPGALAAAAAAAEGLAAGPIRVRVGIHTGTPLVAEEGYVGADVHRAARIAAAGHGGQVLVSASTAALAGSDGLRDLGEHRLKDLSGPERIFQLGPGDFPPLKSLYQTNLPVPATPFLGRERELREVGALLAHGDVRLVTLTGAGGTGKTRLALQVAAEAADRFPQGVWWVPLAPLRDPALVLETAAHALGARDGLAEHVGDGSLLLLFDNFEHLVEAAADLAGLLAACPDLALLITSREPLRVAAEQQYAVPPLEHEEAVDLFLARARAVKPDFREGGSVSAICRRVDELPLALELAAARVKALPAEQILRRLEQRLPLLTGGARDLPERQRTLRATIEWSHDLLGRDEQRLFARLAVFRGGCTLETAEEVCEADLETLESLVDKSLVRVRDEGRYWMLETIREYAAERLEASGEAETLRDRHLRSVLALAEEAYEQRFASDTRWTPLLEAERDNVRAALDWAATREPQAAAQLAGAVALYWNQLGRTTEVRERLAAGLARYPARDWIRARALTHLGLVAYLSDPADPRDGLERTRYVEEALAIWREQGDALGEALALEHRGMTRVAAGDHEQARRDLERSLELRREVGAPELEVAESLAALCQLLVSADDVESAEPIARELYELATRHDAGGLQSSALHYLADCPLLRGDYDEAERRYRRSLAHSRRLGMAIQCTNELLGVSMAAAGRGEHARAVRLAAAAYAQRTELGIRRASPMGFWRELQERHIGGARARLAAHELEEAERAGTSVGFDDVLEEVLSSVHAPEDQRRSVA